MGRIAKKPRSVKGQKAGKPAPRYSIRKDALNRRYAIDKRTGKRVAVSKADKERQKRKKAAQEFRGIKPKKAPKPPKRAQAVKAPKVDRSAAAKKGWDTRNAKKQQEKVARKAKLVADLASGARKREDISESELPTPVPIVALLGALIPEGMRMRAVDGLIDRVEAFPKVKAAAENAWNVLQRDSYGHSVGEGPTTAGSQFDKDHGKGAGDYIRYEVFARARDLQDIEQLVENIVDTDDDYSSRELYTLFFSPDVA
jgi:hypothetical protein